MLRDAFENRVLPFDSVATHAYGDIAAVRRSAGRPFAPADCQIAAVAASRNMAVATRNVRDFADMGIKIVDPWANTLVSRKKLSPASQHDSRPNLTNRPRVTVRPEHSGWPRPHDIPSDAAILPKIRIP